MVLRLTLTIPDLDAFLKPERHSGELTGSVEVPGWASPAELRGTFELFASGDAPETKRMVYRMELNADGKRYTLHGRKHLRDDLGPDLWDDATTLEVTLHEGTEPGGPVAGAGVLRLGVVEQFALLRSMRAVGVTSRLDALAAVTAFFHFFISELFKVYGADFGGRTKARMVGWYAPSLFVRAGVEVVVSSMFSKYADQRLLQALAGDADVFDYTRRGRQQVAVRAEPGLWAARAGAPAEAEAERSEVWIDYVADTGDGWDSTYAVAYLTAQPALTLPPDGGRGVTTQGGEVLVFGGDQVYPSASREEYQTRLVAPYRAAYGARAPSAYPDVYAVPGNHDWYDGLVSFSRMFCSDEPFAGPDSRLAKGARIGCETPQRRSYFALKLPHGWWLLGTDVQLRSDLDGPQLNYFKAVAEQMGPGDRVILCVAEPHWMYPKRAKVGVGADETTALDVLEQDVLGSRVQVFLAGDVHHYKRYAADDDSVQKITAGGGGAFLHPTHGQWPSKIDHDGKTLTHRKSFPSVKTSWLLGLWNLLFLPLNLKFGLLTGAFYLALASLLIIPAVGRFREAELESQRPRLSEIVQLEVARQVEQTVKDEVETQLASRGRATQATRDTPAEKPQWKDRVETATENARKELQRYEKATRPRTYKDWINVPQRQDDTTSQLADEAQANRQNRSTGHEPKDVKSPVPMPGPAVGQSRSVGNETEVVQPGEPREASLFERFRTTTLGVLRTEASFYDPREHFLSKLLLISILILFYFFTDLPNRFLRFVFGFLHMTLHFVAAYILVLLAITVPADWAPPAALGWLNNFVVFFLVFVGGFLIGPCVMGVYLGVALNCFKRHWNEAFSSLRIQDWKNFLRLHVGSDGVLTIYPVGLRRVPRRWKDGPGGPGGPGGSSVVPDDDLRPVLIEPPIRVVPRPLPTRRPQTILRDENPRTGST